MIVIEMNEIGLIFWTIAITFPSFLIAVCLLIATIQDFKNTKKKKTESQRKLEILSSFLEWYEKYKKEEQK